MSRWLYLFAMAAVAYCSGCNFPYSIHPLSDETTSVLDERLIGHWEVVPRPDEAPEPPHAAQRVVFARVAEKPNVLETVALELADGVAKVRRTPVYTTRLREERYLSILNNPEEPKEDHNYLIMLYRLEDDSVKFFLPRADVIGPAIERGDLKGEAVREPPDPDAPPPEQVKPKYKSVKITASPKELAEYFGPRGAAPFYMPEYFQMRRIEPR